LKGKIFSIPNRHFIAPWNPRLVIDKLTPKAQRSSLQPHPI
jgi:hypothetical protein